VTPTGRFFCLSGTRQLKKTIETACGAVAALALFGIMALTFFDVGGRKLLSNSIPGSLELTELLMVAVIFAGLPLVSLKGEHIVFDSMDSVWGTWGRKLVKLLVNVLCAAAMLGLAWLMWKTGNDFAGSGETTAQLRIPKYPFIYGMSVLCALTGLVHLAHAITAPAQSDEAEGGVL
jgi:TRAP-type C4-dicarboxylate transport system permease small subunit